MKAYSLDFRQKIIQVYLSEKLSYRQLAQRFGVSLGFIQTLITRWKQTNSLAPLKHRAHTSKYFSSHVNTVQQLVHSHPDATLAELCALLFEKTQISISPPTMCRWLKCLNLTLKKNL